MHLLRGRELYTVPTAHRSSGRQEFRSATQTVSCATMRKSTAGFVCTAFDAAAMVNTEALVRRKG